MSNSISRNWNTDENYWSLHPQMKTIKLFRELYNKDKPKAKNKSSKIMWAIALLIDPHEENPWRNIDIEEKKKLIAEDFLEDEKFKWEAIEDLITCYQTHCLSVAEKALAQLTEKISDRANFLDKTKYTMDEYSDEGKLRKGTADQLDKMMINTSKIYDQLDKVQEMLSKEAIEGTTRGGASESAAEKGEL